MGEFGGYTTEEINEWQNNPSIRSILTSSMMGAWLMRRDANIELQLGKAVRIPQNATNGDVIKTMFNCMVMDITNGKVYVEKIYFPFDEDWWNAPYEGRENADC